MIEESQQPKAEDLPCPECGAKGYVPYDAVWAIRCSEPSCELWQVGKVLSRKQWLEKQKSPEQFIRDLEEWRSQSVLQDRPLAGFITRSLLEQLQAESAQMSAMVKAETVLPDNQVRFMGQLLEVKDLPNLDWGFELIQTNQ